MHSTRSSKW